MKGTGRVFSAEAQRLLHGRLLLLAAALLAAVAALRVLAAHAAAGAAHATAIQRALSAGREPPATPGPGNAFLPFAEGWGTGLTVGTLLLLIVASHGLAADRERGLLRLAATRSATRGALVLGRALLGVPLVVGLLALTGVSAYLAADALFVFGPLVEHGYELASASELVRESARAALATLPPLLATWAFGLAVSCVARSAVFSVATALVLWLGFDLFKEVLGERQYLVFAAFNPSLVDRSCMAELAEIAQGLSDAGYGEALYRLNLWLPWPQALLLLGIAWISTARRAL